MKQKELAVYLKLIIIIVTILFLFFIVWFLPTSIMEIIVPNSEKENIVLIIIGYLWVGSIPCLLALFQFFKICGRIGNDNSFCIENAIGLKNMSIMMFVVTVYGMIGLAFIFISGFYHIYKFSSAAIMVAIVISITLAIVCAALSHLVQKASVLQEEHDLTV